MHAFVFAVVTDGRLKEGGTACVMRGEPGWSGGTFVQYSMNHFGLTESQQRCVLGPTELTFERRQFVTRTVSDAVEDTSREGAPDRHGFRQGCSTFGPRGTSLSGLNQYGVTAPFGG